MHTSPIQPIEIFFQELSVMVDEPDNQEDERLVPTDFFQWAGVQFYSQHNHNIIHEGNRSLVEVKFQFEIPNTDDIKLAYKIRISISGKFATLDYPTKKTEEELLDLAVVNGTSLLYSAIREKVLEVTSRMKPGAILLPSFNFLDVRPSLENDNPTQ